MEVPSEIISNNTTILVSVGSLIAMFAAVARIVYKYAQLELNQKYQEKDLNSLYEKLRELRQEIKER